MWRPALFQRLLPHIHRQCLIFQHILTAGHAVNNSVWLSAGNVIAIVQQTACHKLQMQRCITYHMFVAYAML